MPDPGNPLAGDLQWLTELGISADEMRELNICVPGEFTLPNAYYVNTGSPRIVYRGTEEGTLPLVAGRWYSLPKGAVARQPELTRSAVSVARAPRLIG